MANSKRRIKQREDEEERKKEETGRRGEIKGRT